MISLHGQYLLLACLWTIWCAAHSLLVSVRVTDRLQDLLGDRFRFYRLFFNFFSLVSLVPLLLYTDSLRAGKIFEWKGWLRIFQIGLLGTAVSFAWLGGRRYDLMQFVGLRQLETKENGRGLTRSGNIDTGGILGLVRHPWYAAGLALIWARDLTLADLIANGIVSVYLFVGSLLEERKLVREFGAEYEEYRRRVPMLVPWRWLAARIRRGMKG